jgi:hypothetical protein
MVEANLVTDEADWALDAFLAAILVVVETWCAL